MKTTKDRKVGQRAWIWILAVTLLLGLFPAGALAGDEYDFRFLAGDNERISLIVNEIKTETRDGTTSEFIEFGTSIDRDGWSYSIVRNGDHMIRSLTLDGADIRSFYCVFSAWTDQRKLIVADGSVNIVRSGLRVGATTYLMGRTFLEIEGQGSLVIYGSYFDDPEHETGPALLLEKADLLRLRGRTLVGGTKEGDDEPLTIQENTNKLSNYQYYAVTPDGTPATYVVITPDDTYKPITISQADGGTISANRSPARPGEIVTLYVTPNTYDRHAYALDTLTITSNGREVPYTMLSENVYTFTMPEDAVEVSATFKASIHTYMVAAFSSDGYAGWISTSWDPDLPHYVSFEEEGIDCTFTSNVAFASPGDTVTLTATPDKNYILDHIEIEYKSPDGRTFPIDVSPVDGSAGRYTFQMPSGYVWAFAYFRPIDFYRVQVRTNVSPDIGEVGAHGFAARPGDIVVGGTTSWDDDYELSSLKVTCNGVAIPVKIQQYDPDDPSWFDFEFTMPEGDVDIFAVFSDKPISDPEVLSTVYDADGGALDAIPVGTCTVRADVLLPRSDPMPEGAMVLFLAYDGDGQQSDAQIGPAGASGVSFDVDNSDGEIASGKLVLLGDGLVPLCAPVRIAAD